MKTRDSGMPHQEWWSTFFDPPTILRSLGFDHIQGPAIDVGSGYGTFTFPLAGLTTYPILAIDIEPTLVAAMEQRKVDEGHPHVFPILHDFTAGGGLGTSANTADVVMLFNILHCERPIDLLLAAREALRPSGRVGIIHWRSDVPTPRGPDLRVRPRPETCELWLQETGFAIERGPLILPPFHFGLVSIKAE